MADFPDRDSGAPVRPRTGGPGRPLAWLALPLVLAFSACNEDDAIRHYQVPKKELVEAQNPAKATSPPAGTAAALPLIDQRMLGAIIPYGDQTWYFKMMGPDAAVAAVEDDFEQLIKSVRFSASESKPTWKLPEGWSQQGASGQRLATLKTESEGSTLELTVIPLSLPDTPEAMLANVNRWRNQLSLYPVSAEQLQQETTTIELEGARATLVNIVGEAPPASAAMGRSAGSAAAARPRTPAPQYETPEGWVDASDDDYSICALEFKQGDKQLRLTVTPLSGMAGGIDLNLNRWRKQVGLPDWTPEQMDEYAERLAVQGIEGYYIEAEGPADEPTDAVYGWLGKEPGIMWFIKLRGDVELARSQRDVFRAFLKSFKFYDTPGATNGN
jgi:hypothetical protein